MIIVPLANDIIETDNGIKYKVVSYAPHRKQPAVYVESDTDLISVLFSDIKKINGTPSTLITGKVIRVDSLVKRKYQLPQPDDLVISTNRDILKVSGHKLRDHNKLTNGLLIIGENAETNESKKIRLNDIETIINANNEDEFTVNAKFRKIYKDYLGS